MYFILFFGHLIKHNMKMDNKLKYQLFNKFII